MPEDAMKRSLHCTSSSPCSGDRERRGRSVLAVHERDRHERDRGQGEDAAPHDPGHVRLADDDALPAGVESILERGDELPLRNSLPLVPWLEGERDL